MNVGTIKQLGMTNIPTSIVSPQQMVDISQASTVRCECGSELFGEVYRLKIVSSLAAGNVTNRDMLLKVVAYVCRDCGKELDNINKNK